VTRYRATVAYDGRAYQGFQRQASGIPTIQAALEHAIEQITRQTASVTGAGRTDTGVHATGQVIAFEVDWKHPTSTLLKAINAVLPEDIALLDLDETEAFHPRFDAISRTYAYTILQAAQRQPLLRYQTWYIPYRLDLASMQAAADHFVGEHDFATFGQPPQGINTVRSVYHSHWSLVPQGYGDLWIYRIEANGFLYHMVRRMVGMLVEVGRGSLTLAAFIENFESRDLSRAKLLAPPQGLVLEKVRYSME
jgi:tRNA pseudouridine38-40 synthase